MTEEKQSKNPLKWFKGLILNHKEINSQKYWDYRWSSGYDADSGVDGCREVYKTKAREKWKAQVAELMKEYNCSNVLDVGCGKAWLRGLPGYLGLDWSQEVFKQSGLEAYIVADAKKGLFLPSKSFDAVTSFFFLMHQTSETAILIAQEMIRVSKNLIVLRESDYGDVQSGCYWHDYEKLFEGFDGKVIRLEW